MGWGGGGGGGGGGSFPLGEIFQGYFENDLLILPLSVELDCCLCADTEW